MKKFILALALVSAPLASHAEVVAVVNGDNVTREEIDKALEGVDWAEGGKASLSKFPKDIQKSFIDKFIERKIILDAAYKSPSAKDPEIKEKLRQAEEVLVQQKYIHDLVMKEKTLDKLKEIYNEKYGKSGGQEEVRALHILVKTKEEAEKVRADVVKGNFEKIAKEKSIDPGAKVNGGDLGYFIAGDMVPDFSKAAFALKKNEISQPVQSQFGWHIIKQMDKRQQKAVKFPAVRAQLEQEFASRLIQEKVGELKKTAKIEYKGDYANMAATPAAPVTPAKLAPAAGKPAPVKTAPKAVDAKPAAPAKKATEAKPAAKAVETKPAAEAKKAE